MINNKVEAIKEHIKAIMEILEIQVRQRKYLRTETMHICRS